MTEKQETSQTEEWSDLYKKNGYPNDNRPIPNRGKPLIIKKDGNDGKDAGYVPGFEPRRQGNDPVGKL